MKDLFIAFLFALFCLFFAYGVWAGPCEFGCKPWVDCLPCSMVKDEDGQPRTNNAPGWCWIRGTEK